MLAFVPDTKDIQKVIKDLKYNEYDLTREDGDKDNFLLFLGVSIKLDK